MSFFEPSKITNKQKEYIEILSSYPSTKAQDKEDTMSFLKRVNKNEIAALSKTEASELIQVLLKRPAEYQFPCGKKVALPKQEVNCYNVMGPLEGCLHACPDNVEVNSCSYWEEHQGDQNKAAESVE